jgi:aspartokinase
MDPISIEGAKLSQELVTINLRHLAQLEKTLSRFCKNLSENQINIQFLSTIRVDGNNQITCCVDSVAKGVINSLIESEPELTPNSEIIESTGLLTLFPHQFKLNILGLVLSILGKSSLSLYGLASSLSSLTIILAYHDLEKAIECLREKIKIDPDRIERRPKLRIRQSRLIKK